MLDCSKISMENGSTRTRKIVTKKDIKDNIRGFYMHVIHWDSGNGCPAAKMLVHTDAARDDL
jgi:hypothetical protein